MKYIFLSSWDSEINHIQNCFLRKEFGDEHDDLITPIGPPRPSPFLAWDEKGQGDPIVD